MTSRKSYIQKMLQSPDHFNWLQGWYYAMCDGEWEHGWGPAISTCNNPGWMLKVNLNGTGLETYSFERVFVERHEYDWLSYSADSSQFLGFCGPVNLTELVGIFRDWASPHFLIKAHAEIDDLGD